MSRQAAEHDRDDTGCTSAIRRKRDLHHAGTINRMAAPGQDPLEARLNRPVKIQRLAWEAQVARVNLTTWGPNP